MVTTVEFTNAKDCPNIKYQHVFKLSFEMTARNQPNNTHTCDAVGLRPTQACYLYTNTVTSCPCCCVYVRSGCDVDINTTSKS